MQDKELKHQLEKEFELERVILFSDAVFAIIITIMVLDVRLPEGLKGATPDKIRIAFGGLWPKIIVYGFSFFLVSAFWIRHLHIFKSLRDYDIGLVVRNLFFLFIISLFPFAMSIQMSGLSVSNYWSSNTYLGIIFAGMIMQTIIIQYIIKHKHKLCMDAGNVEQYLKWKVYRANFILIPAGASVAIIVTAFDLSPIILPYVFVFYAITLAKVKDHYFPNNKGGFKKLFKRTKTIAKDGTALPG